MKKLLLIAIITVIMPGLLSFAGCRQDKIVEIVETEKEEDIPNKDTGQEAGIAVLGGGCFWSIEAIFSQVKGVIDAEVGYAGGFKENPTYEEIYSTDTGHAEVVKITFDPEIISYSQLLNIFFFVHDPTTLNRQGNDIGEQYRSIILFTSPEQEKIANGFITDLEEQDIYQDPIVTEVEPLDKYYRAEDYHQEYYNNNSFQSYCSVIIAPKIEKFQDRFKDILK